jgi:hypothetical protein
MTEAYFRPGVPWVAFVMLIFWCALEAAIFSYTLMPTVTELLADLVGGESTARYTGPILYFFLLLLVMGGFARVQTLMDTVKKREWKYIVQMVVVELFVMFFDRERLALLEQYRGSHDVSSNGSSATRCNESGDRDTRTARPRPG